MQRNRAARERGVQPSLSRGRKRAGAANGAVTRIVLLDADEIHNANAEKNSTISKIKISQSKIYSLTLILSYMRESGNRNKWKKEKKTWQANDFINQLQEWVAKKVEGKHASFTHILAT